MKKVKEMKLLFVLAALFLSAALFGGCGNATKESGGGAGTVPIEDAANVGSSSCKVCHSLAHTTQLFGLVGQVSPNSLGITHECEACHGGGQYHYGSGPIPYPTPDINRCSACHDTQVSRMLASSHNGEDAANTSLVTTSRTSGSCAACHTLEGYVEYAKVVTDNTTNQYTTLSPTPATFHYPGCAACHDPLKAQLRATPNWDPNNNTVSGDQFDVCTSCHKLIMPSTETLIASGQTYTVSTGAGADGVWFTADDAKSVGTVTVPYTHNTSWFRVIASTHFDNPNSPLVVEGYNIRRNGVNPCFDCHGHELHTNTRYANTTETGRDATPTIFTDWAQSAHAGKMLAIKYAVARTNGVNKSGTADLTDEVMGVGATPVTGPAWTYYNWSQTTGAGNRASCQRCHTSTGASNFLSDPVGYVGANNTFSHLAGWTPNSGSTQKELLYCWGCHSNAEEGVLRNPGALSFTYTNNATATYPDVSGSNVCIACHSGRETGDSIKSDPDSDGIRTFINSHYLAAGGTVFTTTGYEYDGRNYDNVTFYAHDKIGTAARPGTGSNGPCVGCHMSSEQSHTFLPIKKDENTGVVTEITATVCTTCHTGQYALTPTVINNEKHEYEAAIDVLKAALATKGMFFRNSYPYYFVDNNGNGVLESTETTPFTNWAGVYEYNKWKDTIGAAFNANLLIHDPGGFAHNRYYVKALIWDSIDFIDDGLLNDSVPMTITNLRADPDNLDTTVDPATAAAASAYLGTSRPGDASRPLD